MHRLGVETTIFARSKRIGIFTSPRLQQLAQEELSKELNFLFETLPHEVKSTSDGVILNYKINEKRSLSRLSTCYLQQVVRAYLTR